VAVAVVAVAASPVFMFLFACVCACVHARVGGRAGWGGRADGRAGRWCVRCGCAVCGAVRCGAVHAARRLGKRGRSVLHSAVLAARNRVPRRRSARTVPAHRWRCGTSSTRPLCRSCSTCGTRDPGVGKKGRKRLEKGKRPDTYMADPAAQK
jgi:hypothetical protein